MLCVYIIYIYIIFFLGLSFQGIVSPLFHSILPPCEHLSVKAHVSNVNWPWNLSVIKLYSLKKSSENVIEIRYDLLAMV